MDIERERGIDQGAGGAANVPPQRRLVDYMINLVDTPGHVDFGYEVSRSLAACDGALLVVDASQGVEAQTLANVYLAVENDLEIIPVLNKIDLPAAEPERVAEEIEQGIGLDTTGIKHISAKSGLGVDELLASLVDGLPSPDGDADAPLRLIFDSWYDPYRGVVLLVRVVDGSLAAGDDIFLKHTEGRYTVLEVGAYTPHHTKLDRLNTGEIGLVICGIKTLRDAKVGDTLCAAKEAADLEPLSGFQEVKPMVFGSFLWMLRTTRSLVRAWRSWRSTARRSPGRSRTRARLGWVIAVGSLGLLHMEIVQERLEREFDLDLITTAPTVVYKLRHPDDRIDLLDNPATPD